MVRRTNTNSRSNFDRNFDMGSTHLTPFGMNRNMFNDPFFTDWDDMFQFNPLPNLHNSINNMISNIREKTRDMTRRIDSGDAEPGTHYSRSFYKKNVNERNGIGQNVEQQTITHVDDKGHRFVEKFKDWQDDEFKRSSHAKFIGDKGVKEMRTHNLKTGEEYVHTDYKNMAENEYDSFNREFNKGVDNAKKYSAIMPDTTFRRSTPALGSGSTRRSLDASDRDMNTNINKPDTRRAIRRRGNINNQPATKRRRLGL